MHWSQNIGQDLRRVYSMLGINGIDIMRGNESIGKVFGHRGLYLVVIIQDNHRVHESMTKAALETFIDYYGYSLAPTS